MPQISCFAPRMPIWGRNLVVGFGIVAAVFVAGLAAQTVRSPASQFPSAALETSGGSTTPSLRWTASTTTGFYYSSAATIGVAGTLLAGTDATYNLGGASNRWVNGYASGSLIGPALLAKDGNAGAPSITFNSTSTKGFYRFDANTIGGSGHVLPGADNTYDVGTTSATWRNGFWKGLINSQTRTLGWDGTAANNVILRSEFPTGSGSGAGMAG